MAGKPGRPRGSLPEWHRLKIALSNEANVVVKKIHNHLAGIKLMTAVDVKVAALVLSKTMPDLKAMEISGDPTNPVLHRVIITGVRRAGDTLPNGNPVELKVIDEVPRITSKDH